MARRKLSKQQRARIARQRSERVREAEAPASPDAGTGQPGRVITRYRRQVDLEPENGDSSTLIRCHVRANLDDLVTGDWVVWRPEGEGTGVVEARMERSSELRRPDRFGQLKAIAANIDQILIVLAPEPEPHANLIDRYLVAAEVNGIPPVLVLNKADLLKPESAEDLDRMLAEYQALGYPTLRTSSLDDRPDPALQARLADRTSILVGQSGVGKTSLIRQLRPDLDLEVGELSRSHRKGTHTTTAARLIHLPGGGELIDSPGIREFGLWHLTPEQITRGFVDILPLTGQCRFRNCAHRDTPGCALEKAREAGDLSERRLQSYYRILEEEA